MRAFSFFGLKFVFDISISGCRTSKRVVIAVHRKCPEHYASIFIFGSKIFSSISRFLEVAEVKGKYLQCNAAVP